MPSTYRRSLLVFVLVAAAGVCAHGCARRSDEGGLAAATMRIGVGAPSIPSPDYGTKAVINILKGDAWLTYKADGTVGERLATSWSWDSTGTLLRLKVRKDVVFHDGTPLTAAVGAQAIRAVLGSTYSFRSVASVEPEGDDTIVLRLKERNGFVLTDLTSGVVTKPEAPDIGTGPFQVVRAEGGDASLAAFPRYFRGKPSLAAIELKNYKTQRSAWTALMRGEIDMLYEVSQDAAEFLEDATTVKSYSHPRPYYVPLVFNVRHAVLKNPQVRQAINEALDRETLVRDGLKGRGTPADGPVWPQHWAYTKPPVPFTFDPASARRRLDLAGYPARPTKTSPVPVRFSFSCLVFSDDSRYERLAFLVQKQLADIGVDMKLVPIKLVDLNPKFATGQFDAVIIEMAGRSLSWVYQFWRSRGAGTPTGYSGADAVFDRMQVAQTDDEVKAAVADLARVLHDDPPAAFIAWQKTSRAVSTSFDVSAEAGRDIMSNLWLWRPAASGKQAAR